MIVRTILALLAALPLAACAGDDLTGPAATACRAAIAAQVGRALSAVTVVTMTETQAGAEVQAAVTGAEAPWTCRTDAAHRVLDVMYSGSEGAL